MHDQAILRPRDLVRNLRTIALRTDDGFVVEARRSWAAFRAEHGLSATYEPLLTAPAGNVKLRKTGEWSLALAPAEASGFNVCRYSTPECRAGCVAYSGKGGMPRIMRVRAVRTLFLQAHPEAFVALVSHEISKAKAKAEGPIRMRLNAFSDIPWETVCPELFTHHADVHFYDYTKWADRVSLPANYRLTYSCSERTQPAEVLRRVSEGQNVAVVFGTKRGHELPKAYYARAEVIDGDKSDNRFDDPRGVVVGLRAKGIMRNASKSPSGKRWAFVQEVAS